MLKICVQVCVYQGPKGEQSMCTDGSLYMNDEKINKIPSLTQLTNKRQHTTPETPVNKRLLASSGSPVPFSPASFSPARFEPFF